MNSRAIFVMFAFSCADSANRRDSCERYASRCTNGAPEICDSNGIEGEAPHWQLGNRCDIACVETHSFGALCVDSLQPVAECSSNKATCWNNQRTDCVDGYPTKTEACRAHCVLSGPFSLCADSPQPIAECPDALVHTCWNGSLTLCSERYPTDTATCGAGTSCVVGCGDAECVPTASLDPRCDPAVRSTQICDGDTALDCWCGYALSATPCGAGKCTFGVCDP